MGGRPPSELWVCGRCWGRPSRELHAFGQLESFRYLFGVRRDIVVVPKVESPRHLIAIGFTEERSDVGFKAWQRCNVIEARRRLLARVWRSPLGRAGIGSDQRHPRRAGRSVRKGPPLCSLEVDPSLSPGPPRFRNAFKRAQKQPSRALCAS